MWPAEIESALYGNPYIKEACVIGVRDACRGKTVKAMIVRSKEGMNGLTEDARTEWMRERMAACKYPRIIESVEELPKSPAGKILWRDLQEAENRKSG